MQFKLLSEVIDAASNFVVVLQENPTGALALIAVLLLTFIIFKTGRSSATQ
ncbi:cytochrome c oxidase subunit 2A [Pseudoduganella violacea]|uniref:Uncharacterized protein n=1 Tax=Pseudoduganella violacea TaxID=1715466 RepID=A0A7W5BGJ5_9BURK|nr:cytochrome c oxidase subunit 2A [Pseudoduganella violacea]MBB3122501.1 hypothetical protein [Pseudoduganella violacea]